MLVFLDKEQDKYMSQMQPGCGALRRLPSAADANAEKEEMAVVERQLSVPWVCGPGWAGSDEDLQLAWAAEMSRGWAPHCPPALLHCAVQGRQLRPVGQGHPTAHGDSLPGAGGL